MEDKAVSEKEFLCSECKKNHLPVCAICKQRPSVGVSFLGQICEECLKSEMRGKFMTV